MGLRYVKSLGEADWQKVEAARQARLFVSLEDFVRRTRLDEGSLIALAEAGAFDSLAVARRSALWDVRRLVQTRAQSLTMSVQEMNPGFDPLSDFEEVGWDYRRTAHSARRHPLEPLLSRPTRRFSHSGGSLPCSRRMTANSAAVHRLSAA